MNPDGTITVPNEGTHDTVIKPGADATVQPDGSVTVPNENGTDTTIKPDGTVELPNNSGTITPEGDVIVNPDGSGSDSQQIRETSQLSQMEKSKYQMREHATQ